MDHQDLRTLQLLEEIENNQATSQRDLAKNLNISLGLVNSFVRRLAHKGYFKITTIPKNRVKYILTPKGAAEKSRLTYEYIKYSYRFYKIARQKLKKLFQELEKKSVSTIIFFGANDLAEIAYISLKDTSIQLVGIIDNERKGEQILGLDILNFEGLSTLPFDKILITTEKSIGTALEDLLKMGVSSEKIVTLE